MASLDTPKTLGEACPCAQGQTSQISQIGHVRYVRSANPDTSVRHVRSDKTRDKTRPRLGTGSQNRDKKTDPEMHPRDTHICTHVHHMYTPCTPGTPHAPGHRYHLPQPAVHRPASPDPAMGLTSGSFRSCIDMIPAPGLRASVDVLPVCTQAR